MGADLENNNDFLEIDFDKKSVKGRCKAKDFKGQIEELREVFGG